MKEVLIVDGYNMIGAWPELSSLAKLSLEDARDRLVEYLADYQGFSGRKVILVFDAHQVPGKGKKYRQHRVDVRYTREKETADECIERLAADMARMRHHVYVATSDYTEQRVTFGQGALRISARELWIEINNSRREMEEVIERNKQPERNSFDAKISSDLMEILEKWRRGEP